MSNKTYEFLRRWLVPVLSAGAAFVSSFGELWNLNADTVKAIGGTMALLAAFISKILDYSSAEYFKNKEIVETPLNNKDSLNG